MKIAVLVNAYPPRFIGGAARIAEVQVELLRKAGHEVRVWDSDSKWLQANVFFRMIGHMFDLTFRHDLLTDIISWQPDLLLTHNLTGSGFATPRAIQSRGVTWFHVLHDVQLFEPSGQLWDEKRVTVLQRLCSLARRVSLGRPDLVISPTQWLLDAHRRRGFFRQTKSVVLPNPGVERRERNTVRQHETDPLRVLFVGGFTEGKGANELSKMTAAGLEWFFIGTGPLLDQVKIAFHQAHFLGALPAEEVIETMSNMDALIVPSLICENQPTVILEALATGLPVIAYDIGGVRETLGAGGLIISVRDRQAVLQALEALRDSQTWETASEQAYRAAERYTPNHWLAGFEAMLKR